MDLLSTNGACDATEALSVEQVKSGATAGAIVMRGLGEKPLRLYISIKDNPHLIWIRLNERYAVVNVFKEVQLQTRLSKLFYQDQAMSDLIDTFDETFNRFSGMGS